MDEAIKTLVGDRKIYPIGTKIYRVLDAGEIIMEKVSGYEIKITGNDVHFVHTGEGRYNRYVNIPEEHHGSGWGSRVHSWHFDRASANKAAAPLVKVQTEKKIEQNNRRIAELQAENEKLEESL